MGEKKKRKKKKNEGHENYHHSPKSALLAQTACLPAYMEEKEEHSSMLHNGSTEVMLKVCVSVWRGGKQTITTTTTYVFSSLPPYSSLLYEFFEGREDGQKKKRSK